MKFHLLSSAIGLAQLLTDGLGVAREQGGDVEIDTWQNQLETMEMAPSMQAVILAGNHLCPWIIILPFQLVVLQLIDHYDKLFWVSSILAIVSISI